MKLQYLRQTSILFIGFSILQGCAWVTAVPVTPEDTMTAGIRAYDPSPILAITCTDVSIVSVPNLKRGYAVSFGAAGADNHVVLTLKDGGISSVDADMKGAGILDFLSQIGSKVIDKLPAGAAMSTSASGALPGLVGLWRLDTDKGGNVTGITPLIRSGDKCPAPPQRAPEKPGDKPPEKPSDTLPGKPGEKPKDSPTPEPGANN